MHAQNHIANTKIVRSQRKTLALHIQPDASVVVKAPIHASMQTIDRFIQQNLDWIQKQTAKVHTRIKTAEKKYTTGESFLYLGKEYTLHTGNHQAITLQENHLLFPSFLSFRADKEMAAWYMQQARTTITRQVEFYAKQMDTRYASIMFSDTKSKWGSCSHDNHLQFCWRLIMAPLLVLNYVVVHELAHTQEKNHSSDFWSKVRFHNPSYRQQRKWLEQYGNTLTI